MLMKFLESRFLPLIIGVLALLPSYLLQAQCNNTPANTCVDATLIPCSTFNGTLPDIPPVGGLFPGCPSNSIDNSVWFQFELSNGSDVEISITPSNCEGSGGAFGMQAGIYSDCDVNAPPVVVQCACTSDAILFDIPNLAEGTYYILVDGCAADVCDYAIAINTTINAQEVGEPDEPTQSQTIACPGEVLTFSIPPVANANYYEWILPPGVVPINNTQNCTELMVIWGSNSGNVRVRVANDCSTPKFSPSIFVEVPQYEGYEYGTYCFPDEPGYFHVGTQSFYPTSIDIPMITNRGCDSTVHLIISEVSSEFITESICIGGESSEINGIIFTEAIDTTFIFPDAGHTGCDSVLHVSIIEQENVDIDSLIISSAACDSTGGTAEVVLSPGTTNVSYSWSNGSSNTVQSNLLVGEYSVTVNNLISGCQSHRNFEIKLEPECYVTISGYVYDDTWNQNCVVDNLTIGIPNILVSLNNGQMDFTDNTGYFEFEALPGTYEIQVDWDTFVYSGLCIDPIIVDAGVTNTIYPDLNFFLSKKPKTNLTLKVSKLNPRPGTTRHLNICVMNTGDTYVDGTLTFVHDSVQIYNGAGTPATNYDVGAQTISWDFENHPPGNTIVYKVYLETPANIPTGTELDYFFKVETVQTDINLSDNEIIRTCTVVNSYDPNDKQVLPVGEGALGGIRPDLNDNLLSYHIRFQNTGTDTAFTVVVRDTLDSDLDIRDVIPGPSSHAYDLNVIGVNVLEFRFENIYLPDSNANEPLSHGFFFYDVMIDRDLPIGTAIHNTAAIYFDFNAPVITNTVRNTVFGPDKISNRTINACDAYTYNGILYQQSVQVVDTIDLIYYDSIVIADIVIDESDELFLNEVYCAGDNPLPAGDHQFFYQNEQGCDSIVTRSIIVHPMYMESVNLSQLAGEFYQGVAYFSDTTFVQTFSSINGCDSVVTVQIDIVRGQSVFTNLSLQGCDEVTYKGEVYEQSTTVTDVYELLQYDSIVTATIEIFESDETIVVEEYCEEQNPVPPGDYVIELQNQQGCDSIIYLSVIVHPLYSETVDVVLLAGEEFEGTAYFSDTTFVQTFSTINGCDSLVTVQIDIVRGQSVFTNLSLQGCDEVTYNGQMYEQSTTVTDVYELLQYDSIVTATIEISESDETIVIEEYCEEQNPVPPGDYVIELQNQQGCDSIIHLSIIVHPIYSETVDVILLAGEEYEGTAYFNDTTFVQSLRSVNGCDSLVTVQIDIVRGQSVFTNLSLQGCDEVTYNGQVYEQSTTVTNVYELLQYDSIVTATIEIFESEEVFITEEYCAGDNPVPPGHYQSVYSNQQGCDSIVNLSVLVHPVYADTQTVELLVGEMYEGVVYLSDTTLIQNWQTQQGCDSIITLQIMVSRADDVYTIVQLNGCDEVLHAGQVYQQSVILTDTVHLLAYDSIIITEIEVLQSDELFLSEEYCEGENPVDPGTYTTIYTNQYDCDSTVHLEVVVHATYELTEEVSLEPGELYQGDAYFSDTTFVQELMSVEGCDSIVTVVIDVLTTGSKTVFAIDQIYPNPTDAILYIMLSNSASGHIRLYDLSGKAVLNKQAIARSIVGGGLLELDISAVPPGAYLVEWQSNGERKIGKVIKM